MHLNVTAGVPRSSLHSLLRWYVISGAVPLKWSTYHLSRTLPFGRSLKNQSCLPCTTASHYQSHLLTFEFAVSSCSVILPSPLRLIVIAFFCPCHCFYFFSWCGALSTLPFLYLIIARPCLHPLFHVAKSCSLKSVQSSLSDLLILSTNNPFNSTCFGCAPPPQTRTNTPLPFLIYNWILSHPGELLLQTQSPPSLLPLSTPWLQHYTRNSSFSVHI